MTERSLLIRAVFAIPFLTAALAAPPGCAESVEIGAKSPKAGANTPDTAIVHEPCDVTSASAEKLDANGDGRPDIVRVRAGGAEVCRMVDLNHDGIPDAYLYVDASGQVRRREADFDHDGKIDEIATYAGGVIQRKDRETNLDGRLDTWDYYEGGKLVRRVRDSDADGKIDQWWHWPNPDKPDCAVVDFDHDGDGNPDPGGTIDVCAPDPNAAPPVPGASSAPAASTAPVGSAPPVPGASSAAAAPAAPAIPAAPPVPAPSASAAPRSK